MGAAGSDVGYEAASEAQISKAEVWSLGEPGVDVDWKGSLGDQSAMRNAGGSQKTKRAAVQKESAETQEYEAHQQNEMEVDRDEGMVELSFIPIGERFCWVTHTINFCNNCYNLRLAEWNESEVTNATWKAMVGEKNSRGELSACLEAKGFESRM